MQFTMMGICSRQQGFFIVETLSKFVNSSRIGVNPGQDSSCIRGPPGLCALVAPGAEVLCKNALANLGPCKS